MKKFYISFIAIFALALTGVNAQVLITENFDYPAGDSINAIHGWAWTSGWTNPLKVVAPGLEYTNYSAVAGNCIAMTTGQDVNKQFASPFTTGSVYASFLVNVSASTTTGDYFFSFIEAASTSVLRAKVFIKKDAALDKFAFGISKGTNITQAAPNNPVLTGYTYDYNTTYLVVVKYSIVAGADNDVATIFVNPALGASEPTATITSIDQLTTQADPANIGAINIRQGGTASFPTLKLDGIMVGTTWANVTTPVGIFSNASKSNASIFPNPVKNVLNIKNAQGVNRVEVSNIIGEKLISENINANSSVNVESLLNGLYFVTLFNNNQAVKTIKFIKE